MQQLLRALAAASALLAASARALPGTAAAGAAAPRGGSSSSRKNAWTQRRQPKVDELDATPPVLPSDVSRASGLSSCLGLRGGSTDKAKADAIDGPCIGIDLGTTYSPRMQVVPEEGWY
ncbi:unnamed protein product, partial [Ectocarpus fasciculatus]